MKNLLLHPALLLLGLGLSTASAQTNIAPNVVIINASMRPGTTLMDVTFRVDDPDDATVNVRALAFQDGVRSFANVIRPVTFVEGTGDKIGDAIPANSTHALVWDVAVDWDIDLGQAKFEILAMDGRGLLSFDWITIPAAGTYPQVTVSKNSPSTTQVLDALYWLYASGDAWVSLSNGVLRATIHSGEFGGATLANGSAIQTYATPFVLKRMNLGVAEPEEVNSANSARAGVASGWLGANRPYSELSVIVGWGYNNEGQTTPPNCLFEVTAIAAGSTHSLALKGDGTVVGWGTNGHGQATPPIGLTGVTAIAAGGWHSLALKDDRTVVGWGNNGDGRATPPTGLTGVTAIAAGEKYSLALKGDGTVIGWGENYDGQATPPGGLTGVTAIAAGGWHSLALKGDSTVVGWGNNGDGRAIPPTGLTGVTAIAAGGWHSLALKGDGTVVGWGRNDYGQATPPSALTGVTAIAAGFYHSLALKSDGTVIGWGYNNAGPATPPGGLTGVTAIAAKWHSLALKAKAP